MGSDAAGESQPPEARIRCRGRLEEESDGRMATSQPNSLPDNFVTWRYPYLTLSGFSYFFPLTMQCI